MLRSPATPSVILAARSMPGVRPRRKTLAVLLDYMDLFGGGYEVELREALTRECRARDLNLLLVYGGALAHPEGAFAAHNAVYELMKPGRVDGLVTVSASLSTYCGAAGLSALFQRSGITARCSAGVAVPGAPSIVVDNRAGMLALMEHMTGHHGYRRVAFIHGPAGNSDAEARFAGYREGLARAGLPYDPKLVQSGDFIRRSGEAAMQALLSDGSAPDAVVVANDGMALGAIAALSRAGLRVPHDVAVTGFDDLSMARLAEPPLTTVAQPLGAIMEHAVQSLVAQLAGAQVEPLLHLPAELLIRDSCGCSSRHGRTVPAERGGDAARARAFFLEHSERIARRLSGHGQMRRSASRSDMERLHDAVDRELVARDSALLETTRELLQIIGDDNERREALQIGVALLREELRPVLTLELDDLFHDVQNQITLTDRRVQVQQRLEIDQAYSLLMEKGEEFSNALDQRGLREGLARALPALGMNTAFISVFPEQQSAELESLLCLVDGRAIAPEAARFPSEGLIPPGVLPVDHERTLLAFPLIKGGRCLGLAVFEYTPKTNGYVVVRDRISVALAAAELHQAVVRSATVFERHMQEQQRLATEERIRALNILAGGVAHDLNNAIGALVALPDVMSAELAELSPHAPRACRTLRSDLESIKSAALRASQTIKDLLVFSSQAGAKKRLIELNHIAQLVVSHILARGERRGERSKLTLQVHAEPLVILASESHLERAIGNLIHNAIEAMDQSGELTIRSFEHELSPEEAARRGVQPGRFAALEVRDTGRGISEEDMPRIFEPFFSSKRLSDRSGSGLGLAIVDGVMKDHGGFVEVQSVLNRGSSFTLYFPLREGPVPIAEAKPMVFRGSGRILVVDDDPVQLRTATRLLEHFGYDVDAVSSGARARDEFLSPERARSSAAHGVSASPYDLVILDMELNEAENGLDLYRRITQLFPRQRAILSSGRAAPDDPELARGTRLSWLAKPYTSSALAEAVQRALEAPDTGSGEA